MDRWRGRVALVTGGSGGIGRALVKRLVQLELKVVTCGRNSDKLKTLQEECAPLPGSLLTIQCDMQKEDEIASMFDQIRREYGRIDILVNNAGIGAHSATLLEGSNDQYREMLETNVLAVAICTREAVKIMKESNIDDGHIINIGSMSGHRLVSKHGHFYAVTKHGLTIMTEGLRRELREAKLRTRVTLISPGYVDTGFHDYALGKDAKTREEMSKIAKPPSFQVLESEDVVESILYVLSAPPHVQVHDILMRPTEQTS